MKATIISLIAFSFFFGSCNQKKALNKILNTDALQAQFFYVQKDRDTTLLTKNGMVVQLKKETFESDSNTIKLEIKEALSNEDIVLAGLTTLSGKQALSSGGMLYINAAEGYKVSIKKGIEVLVPTKNYNADMSVYEGKDDNGKIDWVNPTPLPNDTIQKNIKIGEQIFKANCANCHKVDDDYIGPALAGATTRYKKEWIYAFIKSPETMIHYNFLAQNLFQKWKPTVMTAFPNLTHYDIDAILMFAEAKSKKKFYPTITQSYDNACDDSCYKYISALSKINEDKNEFENNKENFFTLDRTIPIPPQNQNVQSVNEPEVNTIPSPPQKETVKPNQITATFYTINIKTFGWYNIDILLKNESNCLESELFVRLQSKYQTNFNVTLIIPSVKLFVEGGKLKDSSYYGFDDVDGNIPLPQNTLCYILAYAEVDGKLIVGKSTFTSSTKQIIDVNFTETTKEGLVNEIKALKLDGVETTVNDSKNAIKQKEINLAETEAEKLKPIKCNCDYPEIAPTVDSSKK